MTPSPNPCARIGFPTQGNATKIIDLPRRLAAHASALAMAVLLCNANTASAQGYVMEFGQTYNAPMSNFISNSALNNLSMINATVPDAKSKKTPQAAQHLDAPRANAAAQLQRNATELAQRFPSAQRDPMAQAYLQSFDVYRKLEAKFGWSPNDVAGALAAFVVGNYMVLNGSDVPDAEFAAVADQLRRDPKINTTFSGQPSQTLRTMYEQSAMVGTFMALAQMSQKTTPQPPAQQANLRDSARANLKQVLGTDPERLQISAQGMRLR